MISIFLLLCEVNKAIELIKIGKASEMDCLPGVIFKAAGSETLNTFHNFLTSILEEDIMPNDFMIKSLSSSSKIKATKQTVGNIMVFP